MENYIFGFPPVADDNSEILILGSMPGQESLNKQQYYGHARNQFWKILFELFEVPMEENYESKVALLHKNKIALWDVIYYCEREGSLDTNIRNEKINDLNTFIKNHPKIKAVFFNGDRAYKDFKKYIGFGEFQGIEFIKLLSTSPANSKPFAVKLENWKIIRSYL